MQPNEKINLAFNTCHAERKNPLSPGFLPAWRGVRVCLLVAIFAITASFGITPIGITPIKAAVNEPQSTIEPTITTATTTVVIPSTRPSPALALPLAPSAMELPGHRPSLALTLPLAPNAMLLPSPRPDRRSLLPVTPITLTEGFLALTNITPENDPVRLSLKSGEGLAQLLKRADIEPAHAQPAIGDIGRHISTRALPVGFKVTVLPAGTQHGAAIRIGLEDDIDLTLIQNDDTHTEWSQHLSIRPVKHYLTYISGTINTSLYNAANKAGMSDSVFNNFVRVFGFSVDFQREIRKDDKFEVLFEKKKDLITGKTEDTDKLRYISMELSGKHLAFFHHEHRDGNVGWYDATGKSAVRTLMRTPINGARLSSGYGKRKHPVLGYSKLHQGVDFAAPTGSPIMAAGGGVVEVAGRNGNYGNYIRIRHSATYKTAYAHLSGFAPGIRSGTRVNQGAIIGYVGSTGRSTGPHLHYEILVNNRRVNPLSVKLPAGHILPEEERDAFYATVASVNKELSARDVLRVASE